LRKKVLKTGPSGSKNSSREGEGNPHRKKVQARHGKVAAWVPVIPTSQHGKAKAREPPPKGPDTAQ